MVYLMTCYTLVQKFGGLTYEIFLVAIKEMWIEYVIVYLLIFFVISPISKKFVFKVFNPAETNPIFKKQLQQAPQK